MGRHFVEAAETLRSASVAITHSLNLEEVFSALLEHLGRIVPYDRAKVMLLESDSLLKVQAVVAPSGKVDFIDKPLGTFEAGANAAVSEVLDVAVTEPDPRAIPPAIGIGFARALR